MTFPFQWSILSTPLLPGETWHFQYWHRDSVASAATANFSRGLSLQFM